MKCIRENVFESNSSSCHSLVIAQTDLLKQLQTGEVFYLGEFEYYDDHELYVNELEPELFVEATRLREALTDCIKNTTLENLPDEEEEGSEKDVYENVSETLKNNLDADFAEIVDNLERDVWDYSKVLLKIFKKANLISDDSVDVNFNLRDEIAENIEWSKVVDNGKLEIRLIEIYC